jgi:hypothetical protein
LILSTTTAIKIYSITAIPTTLFHLNTNASVFLLINLFSHESKLCFVKQLWHRQFLGVITTILSNEQSKLQKNLCLHLGQITF